MLLLHVHEFLHLVGLPDLLANHEFDIMNGGPYLGPNFRGACPAPLNPQSRYHLGWMSLHNITSNSTFQADYSLQNSEVFQIKDNANPNRYWLIENRNFNTNMTIGTTSTTDYNHYLTAYISNPPNKAVLVWKVNSPSSDYATILHADGEDWNTDWPPVSDGIIFPGYKNVKVLSPYSDSRSGQDWYPNTKPSTNVGMLIANTNAGTNYFTLELYNSISTPPSTISSNQTLNVGMYYTPNNITVNSGVLFTIQSNTVIYFASGKQLIVHGRVVANGADFFITLNGSTWNGINIDGSTLSSFTNCTINGIANSAYGLTLGGSNNVAHQVSNCYIEGGMAAVYIKSSSDPTINNSYLNCTGSGHVVLSTDNSNGKINNCKLYSSGINTVHGHYNMNSATPSYDYPADGLNLIDGTNFTSAASSIYVSGGYPNFIYGYNSIPARQMLYQYSNHSGSSRDARYNYWGGGAPAVEGTVVYSPYLTTPHANVGPNWALSKYNIGDDEVKEDNPLANAWKEYYKKNFGKSKEMAKVLFQSKNTEEQSCEILFLWMKSALCEGSLKEEENNLLSLSKNSLINELGQYESLRWLAKLTVRNGDFQKAEEYALSIPSTSFMGREILFDVASEIMQKSGDIKKVSLVLDKLTERYTDKETLKEKQFVLNLYSGNSELYSDSSMNEPQLAESKTISLNLVEAYPNPFNPTTTISYVLPKTSTVTLKVYDVLGREVATLLDEKKPAGKYTVNFNGDRLASGIYFYSLQTNEKFITKKMLLLK